MAKTKLSEYNSTASNNTDIDGININEGCTPSGINNAIREVMAHLKDFQSGAVTGNSLAIASGGTGAESASAARTNIEAAKSGANSDITSLTGLTTALSAAQGGTGVTSMSALVTSLGLDTTSDAQFDSLGIGTTASGTTGEIRATNNITAYYSDDRLKTKHGNIEEALKKIHTLNGFYYSANQTAQDLGYEPKKEVGVSAQEVNAIMPEVIAPAPIDEQYMTVHYDRLVPLLIEGIKELSHKVTVLEKELHSHKEETHNDDTE
jgi:hypothetical protein